MKRLTKENEDQDFVLTEHFIEELIKGGESQVVEFKSSLQWDIEKNCSNKELKKEVLKTLVAFLNTDGGILLIGVEDNGNIFGLEKDLRLVKGKSLDGFEQNLANLISDKIGEQYIRFIRIHIVSYLHKYISVIRVKTAPEPVFLQSGCNSEFFVRVSNTSRSLDVKKTYSYIKTNF